MPQTPEFPYQDGDVTVLGPEIFASKDGAVISWRGENYVRQAEPDTPHDLTPDALYELASAVRDLSSSLRLEKADHPTTISVCTGPLDDGTKSVIASALRRSRQKPSGGGI